MSQSAAESAGIGEKRQQLTGLCLTGILLR